MARYFEIGANGVWICDLEGRMLFFDLSGKRAESALVPSLPAEIDH